MSDGMTEAFRRLAEHRKINKNVYIEIDKKRKALRIVNTLDGHNEVEIKVKTLLKIVEKLQEVLND